MDVHQHHAERPQNEPTSGPVPPKMWLDDEEEVSEVEEVARDDLFFELMDAVENDDVDRVRNLLRILCLSEAAQLDPRVGLPSFGLSPLHCAMSSSVAEMLLAFGIPVDLKGICNATPLISCAGRPGVVNVLLAHNSNPLCTTSDGVTALHAAVLEDNELSVKQLLSVGSDCNLSDNMGNACLHMVGGLAVAKMLLRHGANIDQTNNRGNIPLEEAVNKGRHRNCIEVAGFLFDALQTYNNSKTKQLLDVLITHVLDTSKKPSGDSIPNFTPVNTDHVRGKNANVDESSRLTSIGIASSLDDSDEDSTEEKVIFSSSDSFSTKSKWLGVKQRMIGGRTKLVKLAAHPQRGSEWARHARAAFARRSRPGSQRTRVLQSQFFHSFFELMVRERPELALMILNRQRRFLFQRLDCKTYSYSLTLLGTPLRCTSAVRKMVDHDRYDLIAHPVTQWIITAKFTTCTRYLLYFELLFSLTFSLLLVATFDPSPRHLHEWFAALGGLLMLQVPASVSSALMSALLAILWMILMLLNVREILLRIAQFNVRVARRGVRCVKRKSWLLLFGSSGRHDPS